MAFKIADLFVSIGASTQGVTTALNSVRQQLLGFGGIGGRIGQSIGDGILAPLLGIKDGAAAAGLAVKVGLVGAAAYGMVKLAGLASDLNETISKTEQVFGTSTKAVVSEAEKMAQAFGIPKKEFLDAAAAFGLIGQGAGMAEKDAAQMSTTLAKLAADASSFYNVPVDQALEKIRSGLVGEAEPLRAFGVMLTEDAVKAKALAMGFKEHGGQLANNAKIAARYALIQQGLAKASGDLERTGGGYANQSRQLWGNLVEIGTEIGQTFVPVLEMVLRLTNSVLKGILWMIEGIKGGIKDLMAWLGFADEAGDESRQKDISARNETMRKQTLAEQSAGKKEGTKAKTMDLAAYVAEVRGSGFNKDSIAKEHLTVAKAQLELQRQQVAAAHNPKTQPVVAVVTP